MTLNLVLGPSKCGAITCLSNGTITAGDRVKAIANDDSVTSSGLSSFAGNEIKVERSDANTDYQYDIGIAGDDASSGDLITVYTEGIFIMRAGEAITAGAAIQGAESTDYLEVEAADASSGIHMIGKALTSASAANAYLLVLIRI